MFLFFFYFLGTIFLPWEFQLNFFNSNLWKICRNWNFYERKNSEIFKEHFKFHQMSKTFFLIFYSKFNFNFKTKKPLLRTKISNPQWEVRHSKMGSRNGKLRRWPFAWVVVRFHFLSISVVVAQIKEMNFGENYLKLSKLLKLSKWPRWLKIDKFLFS